MPREARSTIAGLDANGLQDLANAMARASAFASMGVVGRDLRERSAERGVPLDTEDDLAEAGVEACRQAERIARLRPDAHFAGSA